MGGEADAGAEWARAQVKARMRAMDSYAFEHLVADLWRLQGWNATVEQESGDAGVDVRALKAQPYQQKVLIQAKRYGEDNPVGGPEIQQYAALKQQEDGVDQVVVVTSSRFTKAARTRADELNVKLVDGDDLATLLARLEADDLIREYLSVPDEEKAEAPTNSTSPTEESESIPTATADAAQQPQQQGPGPMDSDPIVFGIVCSIIAAASFLFADVNTAVFIIPQVVLPGLFLIDGNAYPEESDLVRGGYILAGLIPGLSIAAGLVYLRTHTQ